MKKMTRAIVLLFLALALVAGGFVAAVGSPRTAWTRMQALRPGGSSQTTQRGATTFGPNRQAGGAAASRLAKLTPEEVQAMTTQIRPAADVSGQVRAAGNLQLACKQFVVWETDGIVQEAPVRVGDDVQAGDLLAALDPGDAETAVERSLLALASAQEKLADLLDGPNQRGRGLGQIQRSPGRSFRCQTDPTRHEHAQIRSGAE